MKAVWDDNLMVPPPYGGFNMAIRDANGGWIASAADLVTFMNGLDGSTGYRFIKPSTFQVSEISEPVQALNSKCLRTLMYYAVPNNNNILLFQDDVVETTILQRGFSLVQLRVISLGQWGQLLP